MSGVLIKCDESGMLTFASDAAAALIVIPLIDKETNPSGTALA